MNLLKSVHCHSQNCGVKSYAALQRSYAEKPCRFAHGCKQTFVFEPERDLATEFIALIWDLPGPT